MTEPDWDEEQAAAEVIAARLGATDIVKRDVPGASPRTHDYDLHVDDRVIALEITSATDGDVRSFWDTVHDQEWEEPSLSRSWGLTLKPGTRNKGLREKVAPLLRTLETEDVENFHNRSGSALKKQSAALNPKASAASDRRDPPSIRPLTRTR